MSLPLVSSFAETAESGSLCVDVSSNFSLFVSSAFVERPLRGVLTTLS